MQRLISSLAIVSLSLFPSSVLAQHYGGQYYPPTPHLYWQNQGGGDTVIYDGRVLTNNLPPGENTCYWVKSLGLPCEYFYEQRNSTGYTTHYVGSPRPRWDGHNYPLPQQNPGWRHNQHWRQPSWNGGGCIYKDRNLFIRIPC